MTVYKNFLRLIWSKKSMIIIYTAIFLITSFMFLKKSDRGIKEFKETPLKLIIIDNDNSELSKNLTAYLQTKNNVKIIDSKKNENLSKENILHDIKKEISLGNADAGIIINPNLEENLMPGTNCVLSLKDGRNANSIYIDMQIKKFLLFADSLKKAEGKFDFEKIHTALKESITVNKISEKQENGVNSWFKSFFNYFAWISFSIILNSIGWAVFMLKKPSLKIRNDVSPVSGLRFSIENFAAQLTVVFLILTVIIGFAVLLNIQHLRDIPIFAYILNSIIYAAVILSMAFMLNAVLKKGAVLGILGTVLPLALSFISGVFMPIEFISPAILKIAKLFPTYYFIKANEFVYGFYKIDWKNEAFLTLFLVIYFTAGTLFNRANRSQRKIELS
ncbi:ABC transporter permease [Treponema pedis]|uniref:ABC-2 type transporter transmembrane domain-containing protein n=1 Tax=Treponema pedis str. T A4 TaxID=1291379 RepID=S6A864_9SPIR|nr:ABC transporter permease [Treponema pedis]AGT43284.1 hypothetical protein TPE_0788 [Treponema pedis str. T A4]